MSDLAVFFFGCVVTAMCLAAVTLLLWGAYQDGQPDGAGTEARE